MWLQQHLADQVGLNPKEHVLDDWPPTYDVLRCVIIEWSQEMQTARLRIEDLIDLVESGGFHQPIKAGQEWEFA
jgi:hypothetical protein